MIDSFEGQKKLEHQEPRRNFGWYRERIEDREFFGASAADPSFDFDFATSLHMNKNWFNAEVRTLAYAAHELAQADTFTTDQFCTTVQGAFNRHPLTPDPVEFIRKYSKEHHGSVPEGLEREGENRLSMAESSQAELGAVHALEKEHPEYFHALAARKLVIMLLRPTFGVAERTYGKQSEDLALPNNPEHPVKLRDHQPNIDSIWTSVKSIVFYQLAMGGTASAHTVLERFAQYLKKLPEQYEGDTSILDRSPYPNKYRLLLLTEQLRDNLDTLWEEAQQLRDAFKAQFKPSDEVWQALTNTMRTAL